MAYHPLKTRHIAGLTLLLSLLPGMFMAATRTWDGGGANALASNPANWVGDIAPVTDDTIVLDTTGQSNMTWDLTNITMAAWTQIGYTGIVTITTVYGTTGFTNLNITGNCIISNGVWTQIGPQNSEVYRLSATIGGNLVVGLNAMIDVIGKGYVANTGPGTPPPGAIACGSYGGVGNYYTVGFGKCYGSTVAPTNLGSGGMANGLPGGGAILLTVTGRVSVNGSILAESPAHASNMRPGSGGSILITGGAFDGTGIISASGGNSWGGGGGGRVALVATDPGSDFSVFTGSIRAWSGTAYSLGPSAAGTVYLETESDSPGRGTLIVDNRGLATTRGLYAYLDGRQAVTCEFSRIVLTNCGVLAIASNHTLIATNTVFFGVATNASEGIFVDGGSLVTPAAFVYSNIFIQLGAEGSTLNPATSLTIGTNGAFIVDWQHRLTGDVVVEAGGLLTHSANSTTELYTVNLTIDGGLTVREGGKVDVTGKGYTSGGWGPGGGSYGSYGGRGGYSSGGCYGSVVTPTNVGSSGAQNPGGGAILLTVSGTIQNNGLICADGFPGGYVGAGGSVLITAGTLLGTGVIRANGGGNASWGGGGGRVAISVTNTSANFSNFTGAITALSGGPDAGAGTVYLRTASETLYEGTLIVDNNSVTPGSFHTDISSNVTDTVVGNVIIRNKGYLLMCTNQTLTVNGSWSNGAIFAGLSGSIVIFEGDAGSTSTLYGANTFKGLVCTNSGGKTLLFEVGNTSTIPAQGRLTLIGAAAATNLFLRSTLDGTAWKLNVNSLADQFVMNADVRCSDALLGVGAEVTAINSRNSTGNSNWRFITINIGETNIWTGNGSKVWSMADNWNLARTPAESDFILIPSDRPQYPVLDNHRTINGIEIQPGASLSLAGYNLTTKTAATVAGSLTASGTETITFQANADFSGGTVTAALATIVFEKDVNFTGASFAPGRSTLSLAGHGNQTVNPANLAFFKIAVLNSAGIVAFANGFTATELRCEAPGGTRRMQFQEGSTITLQDLILLGSTANTNIILNSSSSGQQWGLNVSGYRAVQGVDVRNSDASSGLAIPTVSSKDSGCNSNWLFDAAWSQWLGASGVNFHDAANWLPPGVPGITSRVLVESTNPMTITGAVTILDLTVGGSTGAAFATASAPLTVIENIVVLTNGTLALNRPGVVSNSLRVLGGGTLTHSVNATIETNKLDLIVCCNVSLDVNGVVDVSGKGYAAGANGPGGGEYGCYGGRGGHSSSRCYGSILAPVNLGSAGNSYPGGGAILLTVTGTMRNDGGIYANGAGTYGNNYLAAGGSIYLTAGALIGSGAIRAHGGYNSSWAGGGGRIALVITGSGADFSGFTGAISASSAGSGTVAGDAGAGTIYRQVASELPGRGTVLIDNNNLSGTRNTDVPPSPPNVSNEVEFTSFNVANSATLRLTNDFMLGDIHLLSANASLDLGFKILTVRSREHALGPGVVTNYGAIIWWPDIPKGVVFSVW